MKKIVIYIAVIGSFISIVPAKAQVKYKVENGQIYVDDGTLAPHENKYSAFTDSLDHILKANPNDTTALFFRALIYLRYNSVIANPNLNDNKVINCFGFALTMADKADSLKMTNFHFKVLRAQICKELTTRLAPIDLWRYTPKQIADRKKHFEQYKKLANRYYDELALIDKRNEYDYNRLKVK